MQELRDQPTSESKLLKAFEEQQRRRQQQQPISVQPGIGRGRGVYYAASDTASISSVGSLASSFAAQSLQHSTLAAYNYGNIEPVPTMMANQQRVDSTGSTPRQFSTSSAVSSALLPAKPVKSAGPKVKPVPPQMVKEYDDGAKNPISAVHEYSALFKIPVSFKEVPVQNPAFFGQFAYECTLDGKTHPQGVGKTKKDAKTKSAQIAFDWTIDQGEKNAEDGGDEEEDERIEEEIKTDETADKYSLGHKHPVMMLHELMAKKGRHLVVKVYDGKTDQGFRCDIFVDGMSTPLSVCYANNKQEAKKRAGEDALKKLLADDAPSQTERENMLHFDIMHELVMDKMALLRSTVQYHPRLSAATNGICAAFIIKRDQSHRGDVVAVGTGECCMMSGNLRNDGRCLLDCHAEVIARRALIKWLYQQLTLVFQGQAEHSIFEVNSLGNKLKLRDTVSLHLYLSGAPCGDASAFPLSETTILSEDDKRIMLEGLHLPKFEDKDGHGELRIKLECGSATTPMTRVSGTGCGVSEERFRTMSCSDKMFKWNVVGIQGSLLSHFLEPVYVNSVTLGNQYDHGHLVRAICCRLPADTRYDNAPEGFTEHHPIVGRISIYEPLDTTVRDGSMNWCAADERIEIIKCSTGMEDDESPFLTGVSHASRLSKAGFFFRFRECAKISHQTYLLEFKTYRAAKQASTEYAALKGSMYRQLENCGRGRWLLRPAGLQNFSG